MLTEGNAYDQLLQLFEKIDSQSFDCTYHIENLRAAVLLSKELSDYQRQQLNVRLYLLSLEARTAREKRTALKSEQRRLPFEP
jgi:hypothetical protein